MTALARENLLVMLQAWIGRWTGVLHLAAAQSEDAVDRVVPLNDGAIADVTAWNVLADRMATHRFTFEERRLAGLGNRRIMGALLMCVAREHQLDLGTLLLEAQTGRRVGSRASPVPLLSMLPGLSFPIHLSFDGEELSVPPDQRELLRRGRELLARQEWPEADAVLSQARNLRMDHAPTLACLAWARFNNHRLPVGERQRDAAALVQMASMLAPHDREVERYGSAILDAAQRHVPDAKGGAR